MISLTLIQQAITLPNFNAHEHQMRMSPIPRGRFSSEEPRKAGVLVLIFPHDDGRNHILLTRRNENLRGHSGQISFPGGKRDETDADFAATALRETCEELGICQDIHIIGQLSQIHIPPSNFDVFPVVGTMPYAPHPQPNPDEVAEVFSLAVDDLLNPHIKQRERRNIQGYDVEVPYYAVNGHKVWGATAIMLGELEARLRLVLDAPHL